MCLLGARRYVLGEDMYENDRPDEVYSQNEWAQFLGFQNNEMACQSAADQLVQFNDGDGTSHTDILGMLDAALGR